VGVNGSPWPVVPGLVVCGAGLALPVILLRRVLAAARHDGELPADIDLDRLVDQIVALVDGFGLQGVLDPQHPQPEQLASRLGGAVDALIRAAHLQDDQKSA
jgi:hypothetical protein